MIFYNLKTRQNERDIFSLLSVSIAKKKRLIQSGSKFKTPRRLHIERHVVLADEHLFFLSFFFSKVFRFHTW